MACNSAGSIGGQYSCCGDHAFSEAVQQAGKLISWAKYLKNAQFFIHSGFCSAGVFGGWRQRAYSGWKGSCERVSRANLCGNDDKHSVSRKARIGCPVVQKRGYALHRDQAGRCWRSRTEGLMLPPWRIFLIPRHVLVRIKHIHLTNAMFVVRSSKGLLFSSCTLLLSYRTSCQTSPARHVRI